MLVPSFPPGDIRSIYLHWTGSDYAAVFPAYHYCIALSPAGAPTVVETHDPRANMRDVRDGDAPYAAHTFGRNSYALGLAICGMGEARPDDFGRFPLRDNMIEACCELAAQASTAYRIAIDVESVRTHAEAALVDGYFGAGPDQRWDIARLTPSPQALEAADALRTGELLRARIRAHGG